MEDSAERGCFRQYRRKTRRELPLSVMRRFSFFLILLIVVFSGGYLLKEKFFNKDITEEEIVVEDVSSAEEVRLFSLFGFSESGEKTWHLKGKSADIFSDIINLFDVEADSYGKEVTVNLTADEGVFFKESSDIILKKNVVIITDEGTTLTTESLKWHATNERITTEDYVYIKRENMDIEGTGAQALPNLKKAQLNKDVTVDIKDPPSVITCDGPLKIDYAGNIAYFFNNVKLVDKDIEIDADKAIAYFDPKERSLSKFFCEGNVKVTRGKDISYSENLTYLAAEGRVVLGGRPKIVISETSDIFKKEEDEPAESGKTD